MNKKYIKISCLLTIVFSSIVYAQDYEKGHLALQIFDQEGMANAPLWVRVWIMFLAASFAAGLLFVRKHIIARWVVGCFAAGIVFLSVTPALGIIQLSGFIALMHIIFWSPALYQLLSKRPFLDNPKTAFSIWSGVITAVILFSFIFDIRDAVIYLGHVL